MSIRTITLNGVSTDDLGIWVTDADYGELGLQQQFETLPYRDGYINFTRMGGKQAFEPVKMTYTLAFCADTPDLLSDKIRSVRQWAYSAGGTLLDDYFSGWKFVNVQCVSVSSPEYLNMERTKAKMRIEFLRDPYMESTTGVRADITQLAGRVINAFILKNSVLCLNYIYPASAGMGATIDGTTMTLTYTLDSSYAGLRCFDVSGTPDFELTGGTLDGVAVTLAGTHNFFASVPASGGTLTLKATVAEGASSPFIIIAIGAGLAFAHDNNKHYVIEDYAVGTHTLKINGISASFAGFTISGEYDTISIVGEREGVYDLRYDSVSRSL